MRRLKTAVMAALAAVLVVALATAAAPAQKPKKAKKAKPFPALIQLPSNWQPEGIASGTGNTLYVGSIPTGAVRRINARTGAQTTVVQPDPDRRAVGLKFDDGRLYVAGGPLGRAFVYDASTGALIADVKLTDAPTYVNDVTLTNDAAYFTDSQRQQLYRVDRQTH